MGGDRRRPGHHPQCAQFRSGAPRRISRRVGRRGPSICAGWWGSTWSLRTGWATPSRTCWSASSSRTRRRSRSRSRPERGRRGLFDRARLLQTLRAGLCGGRRARPDRRAHQCPRRPARGRLPLPGPGAAGECPAAVSGIHPPDERAARAAAVLQHRHHQLHHHGADQQPGERRGLTPELEDPAQWLPAAAGLRAWPARPVAAVRGAAPAFARQRCRQSRRHRRRRLLASGSAQACPASPASGLVNRLAARA